MWAQVLPLLGQFLWSATSSCSLYLSNHSSWGQKESSASSLHLVLRGTKAKLVWAISCFTDLIQRHHPHPWFWLWSISGWHSTGDQKHQALGSATEPKNPGYQNTCARSSSNPATFANPYIVSKDACFPAKLGFYLKTSESICGCLC